MIGRVGEYESHTTDTIDGGICTGGLPKSESQGLLYSNLRHVNLSVFITL